MMGATSAAAGVEIKVDGSPLTRETMEGVLEVKVKESLFLPAVAQIKIIASEYEGAVTAIDENPMTIGKTLEVKFNTRSDTVAKTVFKGEIVSEEPDWGPQSATLVIRALDKAHRLTRDRKSRTFQDMTASDIVSKVAGDHGLSPQTDSTAGSFKHVQQSMETDWSLCSRLALMYNYELFVDDSKLVFRKAGTKGDEKLLTYTDGLVAFRPRITGAGEVLKTTVRGWDPQAKKEVEGTGSTGDVTLRAESPAVEKHKNVAQDLGASPNGTFISDSGPLTQSEAQALAKSAINRLASSAFEAEGEAVGNPDLRAGVVARIAGVGKRFSGKYTLSAVTHTYRATTGYTTAFAINGTAARGLLDLFAPQRERDFGSQLVIGIVTNNDDPDGLGRVRVKIPVLGSSAEVESWWARVLTMSAGNKHGIYSLPAIGDEVVIGFENGDTRRAYVIGSVFNGQDKPPRSEMISGQDSGNHGNYVLESTEKLLTHTVKETEIKSDKPMLLESKDTMTLKSDKDYKVNSGQTVTIEAGSSITIKATGSVKVESSASLDVKGSTVTVDGGGSLTLKGGSIMIG
jgi:phage protein D/phage baseplate assembly protein gpV